jgi:hypothetical protein
MPLSRPATAALLPAALLLLRLVAPVLADEPIIGNILVTTDHVAPGASFGVSGYQLDPGTAVSLTLIQGDRSAMAGSAPVSADGTFSTSAAVPADFVDGYAELVGTGSEGGRWVASVLIDVDGLPNQAASSGGVDPQIIALIVLAIGLIIFAVAVVSFIRGDARKSPEPD